MQVKGQQPRARFPAYFCYFFGDSSLKKKKAHCLLHNNGDGHYGLPIAIINEVLLQPL